MSSTLVIAEQQQGQLSPATFSAITAARQLGAPVSVVVLGHNVSAMAAQLAHSQGVARVWVADHACLAEGLAEQWAPVIVKAAGDFSHIVGVASSHGHNVLPRAAAVLDIPLISDVVAVHDAQTFTRPIYAGNALARVRVNESKIFISIRATAFAKAATGHEAAEIVSIDVQPANMRATFVGNQLAKSDRPELTSARVVVSGGRALGSVENFKLIEQLADKLGAAVGATRAAVDAGYAPNDYQVGQTGKIVAPELYVAVGVSGAVQHLAGMRNSKVIVAINKDAEAPIFKVADYGLVADLFQAVPEMVQKL